MKTYQFPDSKLSINLFNRFTASLPGAITFSILAGGIGTLILVMFLAGILSLGSLAKFIPWILGFNAAITGYSLLDKTRDRLTHKRIFAMGAGVLMVLLVCLILTLAFGYGTLITASQFCIYGIIGMVFSRFGAWLAIKYHNIK